MELTKYQIIIPFRNKEDCNFIVETLEQLGEQIDRRHVITDEYSFEMYMDGSNWFWLTWPKRKTELRVEVNIIEAVNIIKNGIKTQ